MLVGSPRGRLPVRRRKRRGSALRDVCMEPCLPSKGGPHVRRDRSVRGPEAQRAVRGRRPRRGFVRLPLAGFGEAGAVLPPFRQAHAHPHLVRLLFPGCRHPPGSFPPRCEPAFRRGRPDACQEGGGSAVPGRFVRGDGVHRHFLGRGQERRLVAYVPHAAAVRAVVAFGGHRRAAGGGFAGRSGAFPGQQRSFPAQGPSGDTRPGSF